MNKQELLEKVEFNEVIANNYENAHHSLDFILKSHPKLKLRAVAKYCGIPESSFRRKLMEQEFKAYELQSVLRSLKEIINSEIN